VRVAEELLGAPTTGRVMPGHGPVIEGVKEVKLVFQVAQNVQKRPVRHTYWLKNRWNAVFYLKVLNKINSCDFFEEYINFKKFSYLSIVELLFRITVEAA
jgi:hypothetical protein